MFDATKCVYSLTMICLQTDMNIVTICNAYVNMHIVKYVCLHNMRYIKINYVSDIATKICMIDQMTRFV